MAIITSNFNSLCSVLLCAVAAACILQHTSAMPVPVSQSAQTHFFPHFTLSSPASGRFVRMLDSKLVDGNSLEPSKADNHDAVLWDLIMLEDGLGLENVAYPGHYLMVGILGSKTVLFAHDIRTPPTRSYVEGLLRMQEAAVSGSGSGDATEAPTVATAATTAEESTTEGAAAEETTDSSTTEAVTEDTTVSTQQEEEFVVYSSWQFETLGMALARFQTTSTTHDCFLAFESNGRPSPNLCAVSGSNYRAKVQFFPYSPRLSQ